MSLVTGHQEVRVSGFSTFEKPIVRVVGRHRNSVNRLDQHATAAEPRQKLPDLLNIEFETGVAQDAFVFLKNGFRNVEPNSPVQCQRNDEPQIRKGKTVSIINGSLKAYVFRWQPAVDLTRRLCATRVLAPSFAWHVTLLAGRRRPFQPPRGSPPVSPRSVCRRPR